MMVHLEGSVVDSVYDNMLISWHEALSPALPCLTGPTPTTHPDLFPFTFTDSNPYLANIDVAKAARAARKLLSRQDDQARKGEQTESLNPPEWWRRTSTSGPNPWPFGTFMHGHGHAHAHGHPHGMPRQDSAADGAEGGRFAALVMQLVEKAREEKARLALGMQGMMNQGQDGQAIAAGSSGAAVSSAVEAPRESLAGDAASNRSSDGSHTRVNGVSGKAAAGAEAEKPDLSIKTESEPALSLSHCETVLTFFRALCQQLEMVPQPTRNLGASTTPRTPLRPRQPLRKSHQPTSARSSSPLRLRRPTETRTRVPLRALASLRCRRRSTQARWPRSMRLSTTRRSSTTSSLTSCTRSTSLSVSAIHLACIALLADFRSRSDRSRQPPSSRLART